MVLNVPNPEFGEDGDSERYSLEGGIMGEFGKMLIVIGGILLLVGLLLMAIGRVHPALGHSRATSTIAASISPSIFR